MSQKRYFDDDGSPRHGVYIKNAVCPYVSRAVITSRGAFSHITGTFEDELAFEQRVIWYRRSVSERLQDPGLSPFERRMYSDILNYSAPKGVWLETEIFFMVKWTEKLRFSDGFLRSWGSEDCRLTLRNTPQNPSAKRLQDLVTELKASVEAQNLAKQAFIRTVQNK